MITVNPNLLDWKRHSPTRHYGRFMLGKSLMCAVAVKVRVINGAFLEACNALDDHYLRLAHELAPSSGMPETTKLWGFDWIVITYPATERR